MSLLLATTLDCTTLVLHDGCEEPRGISNVTVAFGVQ